MFRLQLVNTIVAIVAVNSFAAGSAASSATAGQRDFTWSWYRDVGTDLVVLVAMTCVSGHPPCHMHSSPLLGRRRGPLSRVGMGAAGGICAPMRCIPSAGNHRAACLVLVCAHVRHSGRFLVPTVWMLLGLLVATVRRHIRHRCFWRYVSQASMNNDFAPPMFHLPERCANDGL